MITKPYVCRHEKKERKEQGRKKLFFVGAVLFVSATLFSFALYTKACFLEEFPEEPPSLNQPRNMQDTSWTQFTSWPKQQTTPQPQYMASSGAYTPSAGWGAPPVQTGWGSAEEAEYESEEEEEVEDDENEDVKCGICKNFLVEPRVLGCMHNFCTSCLQRLASKIESLSISTSHFN